MGLVCTLRRVLLLALFCGATSIAQATDEPDGPTILLTLYYNGVKANVVVWDRWAINGTVDEAVFAPPGAEKRSD